MAFFLTDTYKLPSHDELFSSTEKMIDVLEKEKIPECFWRPVNSEGKPGCLLDFRKVSIPVVIIPDLHGRIEFLNQICQFKINGKTVLELLEEKKIFLVFVGDALHTEKITRERWHLCEEEFAAGESAGKYMREEMGEGLSLLMKLFELKIRFPENFHFLKGNHENILNLHEGGNYPFKKYADEGRMVKDFIRTFYGDDILYLLSIYEKNLPLVFCSPDCTVSHAEPFRCFSEKEIINGRLNDEVISGLTWTANNEALEDSVSQTLDGLYGKDNHVLWFAGHRPVSGSYALRQNGRFIQIHNPLNRNVAVVMPGEKFNPEENIVSVVGGVYER